MHTFLAAFAGAVFLAAAAAFYRVARGPALWDRLSGLVLLGTKTLILLLVIGELSGRPGMFVDIALAYALVGFLAALSLAKYFEGRGSDDEAAPAEAPAGGPAEPPGTPPNAA